MNRCVLTLFVLAITVPAVAVEDQYLATAEDIPLAFTSQQLTGGPYQLVVNEWPTTGSLDVQSGGLEFLYTPGAGYDGVDKFQLSKVSAPKEPNNGAFWVVVSVAPAMMPVAGDWNGDGVTEVGRYDSNDGELYLYEANIDEPAWYAYVHPDPRVGWRAFAGDFDGDGSDEVGLYDPAAGAFHLLLLSATPPEPYGPPGLLQPYALLVTGPRGAGEIPVAGDWDKNGEDDIGLYEPGDGSFHLWDAGLQGLDLSFEFGADGGYPVAGDWDDHDGDSVGVYHEATGEFHLRNDNSAGAADEVRTVLDAAGEPLLPVVGDWEADGDPSIGVGLFDRAALSIALYRPDPVVNTPIVEIIHTNPPCSPSRC